MHLGDVYKTLEDDHFVVIQSFATMMNKEFEDSNDLLVVVSPLMVVDYSIASDPARCIIGTQKEIEDRYIPYLQNDISTKAGEYMRVLDEDIKPKIEAQDKIDMAEVEKMLSDVDMEKFKEDIRNIIEHNKDIVKDFENSKED